MPTTNRANDSTSILLLRKDICLQVNSGWCRVDYTKWLNDWLLVILLMLINEIRKMIVAGKSSKWLVPGQTKRFYFHPEQRTKLTDSLVVGDRLLFLCKNSIKRGRKSVYQRKFFPCFISQTLVTWTSLYRNRTAQAQMDVNFWSLDLESVGRR